MHNSLTANGKLSILTLPRIALWLAIGVLFILFLPSNAYAVGSLWDYSITEADTPIYIDKKLTTADVDTKEQVIQLPTIVSDSVSFWGTGELDYIVLTEDGVEHYSFDGTKMAKDTILSVPITSNPLVLGAPDPFPEVVVASEEKGLKHYSFTGSKMVNNPHLMVSGLTEVLALGVAGKEVAALVDNEIKHYSFDGSRMVENPYLVPDITFEGNLLDIGLSNNGFDLAVLEQDKLRWFNFTGAGMCENPALTLIKGKELDDPRTFAIADPKGGYDVAIVDSTEVKHFSFTGSDLKYNTALSVTEGLMQPRAVAIRPDSQDRIIVDGTTVKYYMYDGERMLYNEALSVEVENIIAGTKYVKDAVAISNATIPNNGVNATQVRVRAAHELEENTSVTWYVSANNGDDWTPAWRVKGVDGGTTLEIYSPEEGWRVENDKDADFARPSVQDSKILWTTVTVPGMSIKWKAELHTDDRDVTPKIIIDTLEGVAVRWESNTKPNPPEIDVPYDGDDSTCYKTTTPRIKWKFSDPDDPDDMQSSYRVQISPGGSNEEEMAKNVIIDTGTDFVEKNEWFYDIPKPSSPSEATALWKSGRYHFWVRCKVKDKADAESEWSIWKEFCVIGFERPRIAEIISPPQGQTAPHPGNPTTHILITDGLSEFTLPKAKAGAKVVMMVDSIGPIKSISPLTRFPTYTPKGSGPDATINYAESLPGNLGDNPYNSIDSEVNRWGIEFWTDANLNIIPSGTLVGMVLVGDVATTGRHCRFEVPFTNKEDVTTDGLESAGVIVTEGSIYEDWFVVLQGRN